MRPIPIPMAAQVAELSAAWAAWRTESGARARVMAERRARVLEAHVELWLAELAVAAEPLSIPTLCSRHGCAGVTKSQLTRAAALVLERGYAKEARRGARNTIFYVITQAGRAAAAAIDLKTVKGVLQ